MKLLMIIIIVCSSFITYAKDVNVKGYYRKNGTYVQPHKRSSPDSMKWNNFGSAQKSNGEKDPYKRDSDKDGTPNYLDHDDDNNGISDDAEK